MPTWSGILEELRQAQAAGERNAFDVVRRKYLRLLHEKTGRNILLYASGFTQAKACPPGSLMVVEEDIQGLMEVVHGLPKVPTDLIIHSPGGSAEAAEGIVEYLHTQYPHIRAVVPQMAMSAATMIACGAHRIVMGKHSNLGPTDPQLFIPSSGRFEPAQAILDQFYMAITQATKPGMQAWAAMLQMYGPSLVAECHDLVRLSEKLVADWLKRWMLTDEAKRLGRRRLGRKAAAIAKYLANRQNFLSHGRHLRRDRARDLGLVVDNLEEAEGEEFQDLVLSVFHATTHAFAGTGTVKIIENHEGKAFVKSWVQVPPQQAS